MRSKPQRQIAASFRTAYQQIGLVAKFVGDVPDRNVRPHVSDRSDHGSQRRARHAERQKILRSPVDHGMDVGTGFKDGAVNESLDAEWPRVVHDGISIERELDDVIRLHKTGAYRARQKVAINDALLRQNPIGDGKLVSGALQRIHGTDVLARPALAIAALP